MNNKYGFGEYLRTICEQANHVCLDCPVQGLVAYNIQETDGRSVCDVLQRLLLCNKPDEVLAFVQRVKNYADQEDEEELYQIVRMNKKEV